MTAALLALLGPPIGLLWNAIAPRPPLVIASGTTVIADPESQAFIAADGWYAVLTGGIGLLCGVVGYLLVIRWGTSLGGHLGEMALVVGIAVGGLAGSLAAWRVGHSVGLETFQHLVRTGRDGTPVTGALDLRATAAVFLWPLLGVMTFSVLEAMDVARRHEPEPAAEVPAEYTLPGSVPTGENAQAEARTANGAGPQASPAGDTGTAVGPGAAAGSANGAPPAAANGTDPEATEPAAPADTAAPDRTAPADAAAPADTAEATGPAGTAGSGASTEGAGPASGGADGDPPPAGSGDASAAGSGETAGTGAEEGPAARS